MPTKTQKNHSKATDRAKIPKFESWATTDEEEIRKRRERAAAEPMEVRAVDAPGGFGVYEVSHPAADHRTAKYRVELRSLDEPVNMCDCPDFAKMRLIGLRVGALRARRVDREQPRGDGIRKVK